MGGVFPHLAWQTLVHSHGGTRRGETPSLRSARSRISELASDGCRWPHAAGGVNVSGESAGVRVRCTCGQHRHLYWHLNFRGTMGGTAEAGGQLAGWAVCCCVYTGEGPVDGLCLFVSCLLSLWIVLRAFLVLMLPLLLLL